MTLSKFSNIPADLLPFVLPNHLQGKAGCRHCHGRGSVGVRFDYDGHGKRVLPGHSLVCRCMMVDLPAVLEAKEAATVKATETP